MESFAPPPQDSSFPIALFPHITISKHMTVPCWLLSPLLEQYMFLLPVNKVNDCGCFFTFVFPRERMAHHSLCAISMTFWRIWWGPCSSSDEAAIIISSAMMCSSMFLNVFFLGWKPSLADLTVKWSLHSVLNVHNLWLDGLSIFTCQYPSFSSRMVKIYRWVLSNDASDLEYSSTPPEIHCSSQHWPGYPPTQSRVLWHCFQSTHDSNGNFPVPVHSWDHTHTGLCDNGSYDGRLGLKTAG